MSDDSRGSRRTRRRVLELAGTAGLAAGLSGCLGRFGDVDDRGSGASSRDRSASSGPSSDVVEDEHDDEVAEDDGEGTPLVGAGPTVELETVGTGMWSPVDVVTAPDGRNRLFVVEETGRVHAIDLGGSDELPYDFQEDPSLFLDLRDPDAPFLNRGLRGLAFHPEFQDNGLFYVTYSSSPRDDLPENTPSGYDWYDGHVDLLAEFHAPGDRTSADPGSERILLAIPQPEPGLNPGDVAFGPDGYLYLATSEGGLTHADPPEDWWDGGSAQNTRDNLLGGVLRIDVDSEGENRPYGIPPDNPLVDRSGHRGEYYAWGFRNPAGMSFDGDDCYVADSRGFFQCVYRVEKGNNYGWPLRIGTHCDYSWSETHQEEYCYDRTPDHVRGGETFHDPVVEYPSDHPTRDVQVGGSVKGGVVYRGDAIPELRGELVFGDQTRTSYHMSDGALFAASPSGDAPVHSYYRDRDLWPIRELGADGPHARDGYIDQQVWRVGTGPGGELYVVAFDADDVPDHEPWGRVHRVVPADDG